MTQPTMDNFDPTRPALLVRYGSMPQRVRPLDGELLLLGRGRVCHVGLSGPDIADVHCVVSRARTGWRVQDCGSRIGTRLNGQPIKDAALTDGDTLQIGAFLFEAHLPPEKDGGEEAAPEQFRHLRRSRRRLCRLAMQYRRRLREVGVNPGAADDGEAQRLAETYRERLREFDLRAQRLEEEEAKLAAERERLEREADALVSRTEEAQNEADRRVADAEAKVSQLRRDNERLREKAERAAAPPPKPAPDSGEAARLEALRLELNRRAKELEHLRKHLIHREQQAPAAPAPAADAGSERLREQLAALRTKVAEQLREIEERDAMLEELRQRSGSYPVGKLADIEACEAELNRFRHELEAERRFVDEERQMLEQRAAEMDETMRAMELELSQERARWARERAELDRLREEIRQERERAKRQAGVIERLGPIRSLKHGQG
jgi:pSer/pThr/pTyr-binding forkhead associated (FHA) protein